MPLLNNTLFLFYAFVSLPSSIITITLPCLNCCINVELRCKHRTGVMLLCRILYCHPPGKLLMHKAPSIFGISTIYVDFPFGRGFCKRRVNANCQQETIKRASQRQYEQLFFVKRAQESRTGLDTRFFVEFGDVTLAGSL